jgi:hypothetical protein
MGYFSSDYIKKFLVGRTITDIKTDDKSSTTFIELDNGEYLRFYAYLEHGKYTMITTPYKADGTVKSTIDIKKG